MGEYNANYFKWNIRAKGVRIRTNERLSKKPPTTMNILANYRSFAGPLVVFVIMLTAFGIVSSEAFQTNPKELAMAITVDLSLLSPIVYLLLVRNTKLPNLTVVPVFVLGMIVTGLILPSQHHATLHFIETYLLPFVELAAISIIIWKFVKLRRSFVKNSEQNVDFFEVMKVAAREVIPGKASVFLATELSTFYYGIINWKKRPFSSIEFSYHQRSSGRALFYAVIFLAIVETFVLHLLLQRWSEVAAWIFSAISIYTVFQVLGIVRSLSQRPTRLLNDAINVRYGILNEVSIPFDQIKEVTNSTASKEWNKEVRALSPFGDFEGHNVVIKVKEPLKIHGLYGIKRSFKELAFHLDEPERFLEAFQNKTNS